MQRGEEGRGQWRRPVLKGKLALILGELEMYRGGEVETAMTYCLRKKAMGNSGGSGGKLEGDWESLTSRGLVEILAKEREFEGERYFRGV